jgi:hypothetical protein
MCLQDNLDYASQADINDGEFNAKNSSKVIIKVLLWLALCYIVTLYFVYVQITISGFTGDTYPSDVAAQKALYTSLIDPLVTQILGAGIEYKVLTRRGTIRNGFLPPCEVDLKVTALGIRLRTERARMSRAKAKGFASLYFSPTVSLATRYVFVLAFTLFNFVILLVNTYLPVGKELRS